jgi:hypothetical protein
MMAVTKIVHNGKSPAIKGKAANWAEAAYTRKDMPIAWDVLKLDSAMAIPVTNAQVKIAKPAFDMVLLPSRRYFLLFENQITMN